MKKPRSEYYVNNKQFYEALVEYKKQVDAARKAKEPLPQIPEYIGTCFYLISKRIANRPNFFNYSYKDEMISDGIENSVAQIKSFNPAKSENPFGYFTMIIMNAFLRRLKKEKRQQDIKRNATERVAIMTGYTSGSLVDRSRSTFDPPQVPVKSRDTKVSRKKKLFHTRISVRPKKAKTIPKGKAKPKTKAKRKIR